MTCWEREFEFPTPVVNDHGIIDWMSDLAWLGEFPGHIIVVNGLRELRTNHNSIFRALISIFPHVMDRMRSGNEIYHAVLVSQSTELQNKILAEVNKANTFLSEDSAFPSLNPSQPALIINHDRDARSND